MTASVRLGRWEDVLSDVRPDTVIVDAPYSERTHKGAAQGNDNADGSTRAKIGYSWWGKDEINAFVSSWAPRLGCWMVSITDTDLAPLWRSAMEACGLYAFPPLGIVISGMGVRMQGDGPASWTLYACVARRKRKMAGTKIWRALPGGYTGPAADAMAGGRGKPSWMLESLVADYSDPGMLVCDPCAGWGSTLVAASKLGRRAIGAEVDPEAFAICDRRARGDEARARPEQPGLFDARPTEAA